MAFGRDNTHRMQTTKRSLRGWRRLVGDIALLTALLQILAPLMLSLNPVGIGTAHAATSLEATFEATGQTSIAPFTAICTASGIVYLQTDGEGHGSVPVSADCPFCQLHHVMNVALPSAQVVIVQRVAKAQPHPTTSQGFARPAPWRTGMPTRAPPR